MKGLNLITDTINHHFAETVLKCSDVFAGSIFHGIATSATKADRAGMFPVVYDDRGQFKYIGIDDKFPLMMYHRITSMITPPDPGSYGDGDRMKLIAGMRAAIYADRERVKIQADELGLFMSNGFPSVIHKVPNFGTVAVRIQSIVPDNIAAFQIEYGATPFFLKPEQLLILINYQLETTVKKSCFNICPE